MQILFILVAFIVYLVALTIVSTLLDIAIRIATREKLSFGKLFLPSTLILILWGTVGLFLYDAIVKTCGTDMFNQILNYFMKIPVVPVNLSTIFGFIGIAIFITVIIQTFLIYIVNFNVSAPIMKGIRTLISKITKKEIKEPIATNDNEVSKKVNVDLLSCIFSSIVIFLLIIGFVFLSILASKSLVKELLPIILK